MLIELLSPMFLDVLRFEHTSNVIAIKENHKIGKTNTIVKASGCHGKVKYQIEQTHIPFEVNTNGRISLTKKLNYDDRKSYNFTIKAVANNGKCTASMNLQIDVLNVNKNRPYFEKHETKYHCLVHEETGVVKVWPKIIVKDDDHGDAGKVMSVVVRESVAPFFAKLKPSSGEVVIKSFSKYEFNADRMSSYSFSLQAKDGGTSPRDSPPINIHCRVVARKKKAQNRHAPVFVEKQYIGKVTEGEKKSNIVQVRTRDFVIIDTPLWNSRIGL